ncbi:MAG: MmcQ/YjbR family DNA-binding protein [Raineya sp.]|nr:MmcQ/YjbR family DNA-binding protein [Raineya sp.]MDW8295937.1 MmcQ/YjbR family DNA-binding protein [Raineya sp.]
MSLEELRNYCLAKKAVTEEFPFDEVTLVFKVCGKIFALANIADEILSINLKCSPEKAIELREQYDFVFPGYHMNKKHWNTIALRSNVPKKLVLEWIDESYDLVVAQLPKKLREKFWVQPEIRQGRKPISDR